MCLPRRCRSPRTCSLRGSWRMAEAKSGSGHYVHKQISASPYRLKGEFPPRFASFAADGSLIPKGGTESTQRDVGRRVRRRKATGRLVGVSGTRFETRLQGIPPLLCWKLFAGLPICKNRRVRSFPAAGFSLLNRNESKRRFLQCASDAGFASLRSCRFRDKSGEWVMQNVVADIMSTSRFQLQAYRPKAGVYAQVRFLRYRW